MPSLVVPEFAVSDWVKSRTFYCEILGFACLYDRPEEGFSYLSLDGAELMIDQIGEGRTFDDGHLPTQYPFGRGLNVQIQVEDIAPITNALAAAKVPLYLEVEDKWYRKDDCDVGNRQFVVADPDGYLLRFFQPLGSKGR
ncbi:Catechol 2,3-dioxygenase [Octadecabacter temperatus]|uniref:Bleomycin resistance protein n=1 Tax=Octadecabacter temperatus TaxID=1458307 RepID=A0A0K0Y487_9RHOB|nr:VOC family protein [Octadecabacter temperatus]AKS45793.1 Glyoxalase-like domain protein [Octadecabacter temperatus]SIO00654.1 Catechol 2,3-dioxygenase [Octadecabacter temperatus]